MSFDRNITCPVSASQVRNGGVVVLIDGPLVLCYVATSRLPSFVVSLLLIDVVGKTGLYLTSEPWQNTGEPE